MYKHLYSHFLNADPERIHFAAHSHHLWPDATRDAHIQYWDDSALRADNKWGYIFEKIIPEAQRSIASHLNLSDPKQICFAPNTHEFISRLLSCFEGENPISILTTDGEFHSLSRQIRRLKELPWVSVEEIPVEPFHTFEKRFSEAAKKHPFDLVFCSHVFFALGYAIANLDGFVHSLGDHHKIVVIDGYHSFCALPTDLSRVEQKVFFLAGGYKYAQSGEGVCFMHIPKDFSLRPVNTGWYASFGELEKQKSSDDTVSFANDAFRFWGATFDPSGIYRFNAVMKLFRDLDLSIEKIHSHVQTLQEYFLSELDRTKSPLISESMLLRVNPEYHAHFLTFRFEGANRVSALLSTRGVITDVRGDCLRFGFGLYQDQSDVDRLISVLGKP